MFKKVLNFSKILRFFVIIAKIVNFSIVKKYNVYHILMYLHTKFEVNIAIQYKVMGLDWFYRLGSAGRPS